jgi:hypothetical protein
MKLPCASVPLKRKGGSPEARRGLCSQTQSQDTDDPRASASPIPSILARIQHARRAGPGQRPRVPRGHTQPRQAEAALGPAGSGSGGREERGLSERRWRRRRGLHRLRQDPSAVATHGPTRIRCRDATPTRSCGRTPIRSCGRTARSAAATRIRRAAPRLGFDGGARQPGPDAACLAGYGKGTQRLLAE